MSTRVPTKPVSNAVHAGYDGAAKRDDGIPLYGMDKELADKAAAKFDPKMERVGGSTRRERRKTPAVFRAWREQSISGLLPAC